MTPRARDDDRDAEKHQRRGRRHAQHDNQGGFVTVSLVRRRHSPRSSPFVVARSEGRGRRKEGYILIENS